uniref:Uncharacterized protein n=1 Tax=Meloidogyne enterolobii TaxID=390850 RepID=A0A6V7V2M1_MELEN|nr:unnamed protein product [Meloidogyne enterolobii]
MGGGKEWWFIRIKEKLNNYFLIKKQQIIQRLYWHFPFLFYLISFQSIKLIILIIIIFIIFIFKIIGDESKQLEEILRIYGDTRYLTINLDTSADKCGGLGNMMWRTASLYVIGKQLNRSIYFDGNYKCFYEYKEEFRDIFENNYKIFKFMRPKKQHVKIVSFGERCCHYDSPDR